MKREPHPFEYFLPVNADKLIIGSFPCISENSYGHWFYSGSGRSYFWKLLSEVFNKPADTFGQKRELCATNGIAITDIALTIERKNGTCSDSNLRIIDYNTEAIRKCLNSEIRTILFTSKFVEHHFTRLFPENKKTFNLLPSPSPQANRYIASIQEYKDLKHSGNIKNTYDYRLLKYRELLGGK